MPDPDDPHSYQFDRTHSDFTDLPEKTKGRIDGLLEAASILDRKASEHEEWYEETDRESSRDHHNSCRNTAINTMFKVQRRAIEVAMDEAQTEDYDNE